MSKKDLSHAVLKLFARKYGCEDCGNVFDHIPIISNIPKPFILVDPAPSPVSLFKRPICPKCGSKNLKKIS